MLYMFPPNAASWLTPATMDCMTSSDRAVAIGISSGVVIGGPEGSRTRRAATASNAIRVANPSRPAASDAPQAQAGSLWLEASLAGPHGIQVHPSCRRCIANRPIDRVRWERWPTEP